MSVQPDEAFDSFELGLGDVFDVLLQEAAVAADESLDEADSPLHGQCEPPFALLGVSEVLFLGRRSVPIFDLARAAGYRVSAYDDANDFPHAVLLPK